MPTLLRQLIVLFLSSLISQVVWAQGMAIEAQDLSQPDNLALRFDHLTVDDGLTQQGIYSILQDRHGFMWFGTEDGLNRYDGQAIKIYQNDPRDSSSLNPGVLLDLKEDENGKLWIAHFSGGLSRFDPGSESFTRYRHDASNPHSLSSNNVMSLYQDREGDLWVGTMVGLDRFEPETGTFTHHLPPPEQSDVSGYTTYSILEDRSGILWLATTEGVIRFDRSTGDFKRFLLDPEGRIPYANIVSGLYEDRQGSLWAGARGLYRFNPETESFEGFFLDPEDPASSAFNATRAITEDDAGVIWVGDTTRGLYRFNRDSGTFKRYLHDSIDPNSLNSNFVSSMYSDRQGILWVGTRAGGGVNRVDRTTQPFEVYPLHSSTSEGIQGGSPTRMYLDWNDVLWISTRVGVLNRYDRRNGTYTYYRKDDSGPTSLLAGGWINNVHRDRKGRLWIAIGGNQGGLSLLNEETGRFTHYQHDPKDSTSIASNDVNAIFEDQNGVLWVGADGLNRFDPESGTFMHYAHHPDDSTSISDGGVQFIYEDLAGHLWVGTWNDGLNRFDRETGTFTRYMYDTSDPQTINSNAVMGVYERRQEPGVLWISSYGGLDRLEVQTGHFTHYTSQNSDLPTNTVTCVLGDDEGYLWMATHSGLVRFNPGTEQFKIFKKEDGLQSLEFDASSCHKGFNGELFFGGAGGVNAILPSDVLYNPYPPEVALTGLRVFNEPVFSGPDTPLQKSITETESFTLSHNQNDITLEYTGLHFRHPERNQFAHMLEGYEDEWREVGTERRVSYTNLPPGNYTFRIKAANSDGVWNEEGRSLGITILPPWWRTTLAYVVYGVLFIVGVYSVDRWQRKRLIARERLRAERDKTKAIESTNNELQRALKHLTDTQDQLIHTEKMASLGQLTAGIAHEIKNPLNFVNNFSRLNKELLGELEENLGGNPEDLQDIIHDIKLNESKINEHGERADGIIRSMLEHSRTEPGEKRSVDINNLLDEYVNLSFHAFMASYDGSPETVPAVQRDYDESLKPIAIVPQEIGRVFINLLDNAFYSVNEKRLSQNGQYTPSVSITTLLDEDRVVIRVSDNGTGVSENVRDKIFEPFFTTKPTGSGTGLGLSLSYDIIVKGHGGSLNVEGQEGEGATFVVTLPPSDDGTAK